MNNTRCLERRGGVSTFLHGGMKNVEAQTSAAQTVSANRTYDAFGAVVSNTGSWSGPSGYGGTFGYREDGSQFKLLGHRLYDPVAGRFLSRDPIRDGRNWYTYCEGDPVNGADPWGLVWLGISAGISGTLPVAVGIQGGGTLILSPGGAQVQISTGVNVGSPGGFAKGGEVSLNWNEPPAPGENRKNFKVAMCFVFVTMTLALDDGGDGITGVGLGPGVGLPGFTFSWEKSLTTRPEPYPVIELPDPEPWWQPIRRFGEDLVNAIQAQYN